MFRRTARIVPSYAALFLAIMAISINSPALFYMATAMVATILACRLQAWLAVRGLRLERLAPPAVHVGEVVTISATVWSEHKIKRPLILIRDQLPEALKVADRTPCFPIAPSFDQPIQTRYSFRPLRRGRFRWRNVEVSGTDALGLVEMTKNYLADYAELTVYPARIPISLDLRPAGGSWGTTEAESGKFRGSGIEPRGVREYQPGDPQRYVHWASSARSGRLMVKEFEAGATLSAMFVLQARRGTDIGAGLSTFEVMCGHAVYLSEQFLKMGADVRFPAFTEAPSRAREYQERIREINDLLAGVQPDQSGDLASSVAAARAEIEGGGSLYVMIAVADPELPNVLSSLHDVEVVCLIYDAAAYDAKTRVTSAASPEYLAELRAAGAKVHLTPAVSEVIFA